MNSVEARNAATKYQNIGYAVAAIRSPAGSWVLQAEAADGSPAMLCTNCQELKVYILGGAVARKDTPL